jgi:hypothetical protein
MIHHAALDFSGSQVQQVVEIGEPLLFHQSLQFFQPYDKMDSVIETEIATVMQNTNCNCYSP